MGATYLPNEIANGIDEIRNDRTHGSTYLAEEAVRTMARAAETLPPDEGTIPALKEAGQRLILAKPEMAAIRYMVLRFLIEIETSVQRCDPQALENELLGEMELARCEAARRAAEYVYEGSRVLTCSYSSAVVRAFRTARASSKRFSVTAIESLRGGLAYGQEVLEEVAALGIAAELVSDADTDEAVNSADMVLVGADRLLHDGGTVNGWPTLRLAQAARRAIPFYVVCESFKMDTEPPAGEGSIPTPSEGFELVPGPLITRIITETPP